MLGLNCLLFFIFLVVDMSKCCVEMHLSGQFVKSPVNAVVWECDEDFWSYWECLPEIKEFGYATN